MNANSTDRITLNRTEWVYVSVILLIVLPAIFCFAFFDRIYDSYVHQFVAPTLHGEFGFTAAQQRFVSGKESYDVFVILSVKQGGVLDRAGFRAGDIPVGYKHGFESGFYQDLRWSRNGKPRIMSVVNISEARSGNWQWRKLTVQYRK